MADPVSAETPPPPASTESEVEAKQEVDSQMTLPSESPVQSVAATAAATEAPSPPIKDEQVPPSPPPGATGTVILAEADEVSDNVGDTVDSPVGPSVSLAALETPTIKEDPQSAQSEKAPEKEEVKKDVKKLEKEEQVASATLKPAVEAAQTVTPVNVAKEETAENVGTEVCESVPSVQQPAVPQSTDNDPHTATNLEPIPVKTADPPLSNGLPQETEELVEDTADTTPNDKPDTSQSQESKPVAKTATPAQEEEEKKVEDVPPNPVSCLEESTMQSMLDMFLSCI